MKYLIIIGLLVCSMSLKAQTADNYDISLKGVWNSDTKSDASFQQYGITARFGSWLIQKGQKGVIMLRGSYTYAAIDINKELQFPSKLDQFHSAGFMLAYSRRLKSPKWAFTGILIPQLNSNFSTSISGDDLYINAVALFNYSNTAKSRLSFGLTYSSTLGFPAPIPVISYWKAWNDKWEMNLGFPRMGITRRLSTKNSLALLADINGYNGHIGTPITDDRFQHGRIANRISYFNVVSGLEWQHNFKNCRLRLKTSYSVYRRFELQTNNYHKAYEFDMNQVFNIGMGFDFNL